eukprot:jgi/Psemu1/40172/gm1.40172_g
MAGNATSDGDPPPAAPNATENIDMSNSPQIRDLSHLATLESRFGDGYDSDGTKGPFYDDVHEEGDQEKEHSQEHHFGPLAPPQLENEDTDEGEPPAEDGNSDQNVNNNNNNSNDNNDNHHTKKSVVWLRQELKLRRQPTSGNKAALASGLTKAIDRGLSRFDIVEEANESRPKPGRRHQQQRQEELTRCCNTIQLFPDTLHWRELHPEAPTISEVEGRLASPPKKYNFTEVFDIPEFKAVKTNYEFNRQGNIWKGAAGIPITKCAPREKGCVDPEFQKKHGLSSKLHPWEFAEVFLPLYNDAKDKKKNSSFSFEDMKNWTNWKASLAGAGEKIYKDFEPFESKELRQFFGLYVLHGLCPTARVEYKLQSTTSDCIAGNNFIHNAFTKPRCQGDSSDANRVGNPIKRHMHFKAFLACQDPRVPTPPRKDHPNWKIRLLIKWMNSQCPRAWMLSRIIAVDEMTMRFKGQHIDKRQITYKREGDGFQADTLCDNGYCYQVYMRNDPAPKKYVDMGLSPLHLRTIWLFDSLKDEHHHVGMDNLYNLVMFCKAAFRHSKRVLCHGVTRKANRGIPDCVFQQELKNIRAQWTVRGTVKATVLEGDPECAFFIAPSVYDTKPVHYLSMVTSVIKWVEKEKVVYNVETDKKEKMKFLQLNQLDTYNNGMGGVDIADQLRGVYRLDSWVWYRKLWWSVMFWAIGVLLTNVYKLYLSVWEHEGVKNPHYKAHYNFRRAIGKYWVDPQAVDVEAKARMFFISSTADQFDVSPLTTTTATATSTSDDDTTSQKSARVNDATLIDGGALGCRVQRNLDHFPFKVKKRTQCAMHKWLGLRKDGPLLKCATCNKVMLKNNYEKEAMRQKKNNKYCFKFTAPFYLCGNGMGFCWNADCERNLDLDDSNYCFKFTTPCCLCGNGVGFCWSLWCFLGGGKRHLARLKEIAKHNGPDFVRASTYFSRTIKGYETLVHNTRYFTEKAGDDLCMDESSWPYYGFGGPMLWKCPPHLSDSILDWMGERGLGMIGTVARNKLPKGVSYKYFHNENASQSGKKIACIARMCNPVTLVKEVPAKAEAGKLTKAYQRVHCSFQSTGSCNLGSVNSLSTNSFFLHRKERGSGNDKRFWAIETNHARELYLQAYGKLDQIDSSISRVNISYKSWKYYHSAVNHTKALSIATAYDVYKELTDGTYVFWQKLAEQMLHYDPKNQLYSADVLLCENTQMFKHQRSRAARSRCCSCMADHGGLWHSAKLCYAFGKACYYMCSKCKDGKFDIALGSVKDGNRCFQQYHDHKFFGLLKGDAKHRTDSKIRYKGNWNPWNVKEFLLNKEYMEYLVFGEKKKKEQGEVEVECTKEQSSFSIAEFTADLISAVAAV